MSTNKHEYENKEDQKENHTVDNTEIESILQGDSPTIKQLQEAQLKMLNQLKLLQEQAQITKVEKENTEHMLKEIINSAGIKEKSQNKVKMAKRALSKIWDRISKFLPARRRAKSARINAEKKFEKLKATKTKLDEAEDEKKILTNDLHSLDTDTKDNASTSKYLQKLNKKSTQLNAKTQKKIRKRIETLDKKIENYENILGKDPEGSIDAAQKDLNKKETAYKNAKDALKKCNNEIKYSFSRIFKGEKSADIVNRLEKEKQLSPEDQKELETAKSTAEIWKRLSGHQEIKTGGNISPSSTTRTPTDKNQNRQRSQ